MRLLLSHNQYAIALCCDGQVSIRPCYCTIILCTSVYCTAILSKLTYTLGVRDCVRISIFKLVLTYACVIGHKLDSHTIASTCYMLGTPTNSLASCVHAFDC